MSSAISLLLRLGGAHWRLLISLEGSVSRLLLTWRKCAEDLGYSNNGVREVVDSESPVSLQDSEKDGT